jgi:hypothetical protein
MQEQETIHNNGQETQPRRRGRPADPSKRTPDGRYKSAMEWRRRHTRMSFTITKDDRKVVRQLMRHTGISSIAAVIRWSIRQSLRQTTAQ